MSSTFIWKGAEVKAHLHDAARRGVDETTDAAARRAKSSHPSWHDQTGKTSASIKAERAKVEGGSVVGSVYSDVPHFLFLEIGFRGRPGDRTLKRAVDGEGPKIDDRIRAALPGEYKS